MFPLREDYEKLINSYLFDLYKCGEKYCAYDFLANYHALTFNEIFNCLNKKNDEKKNETIPNYFINYTRK